MNKYGYAVTALLAAAVLWTTPVQAASTQSGEIEVSGLISGPPPADPPIITSPTDGTTVRQKQLQVDGDCVVGLIVKIFSNDVFVGSAICQADGHFSLPVDLFEATNLLIARQYDTANQASPDSPTVKVIYEVPSAPLPNLPDGSPAPSPQPAPSGTPAAPGSEPAAEAVADFALVINYDYTVQGLFAGKEFKLPICFAGGTAPYAVSVAWGQGQAEVFSRPDASCFSVNHIYNDPGLKTIIIRVSDAAGNTSYLQFVVVVNGDTNAPVIKQLFGSATLVEYWPSVVVPSVVAGAIVGIAINLVFMQAWRLWRPKLGWHWPWKK